MRMLSLATLVMYKELEYLKDRTTSPTMLLAYSEAIDIINQHLAEIEE